VVIDGDTPAFKRSFTPVMAQELGARFSAEAAASSLAVLEQRWHVQAPPRPLNLFYRKPQSRLRLDWEGDRVLLADSGESWTLQEALHHLELEPERFSPNVILRPLHQQKVLPAAVFIGGGAEVAYWLELKPVFEAAGVFMPVVLLRNSVLWVDEAGASRLDALGLTPDALFQDEEALVKGWVHTRESSALSLDEERQQASALFEQLVEKVRGVDASLVGKAEADKAALLSALEKLEQRLVKAAKQRHEVELNQLRKLHARLFPERGLQERQDNFSALWLRHGQAFLDALLDHLDPLEPAFTVLVERP
jgi:bacillithiol biosynthesis cysteine-adding enzyme BshC